MCVRACGAKKNYSAEKSPLFRGIRPLCFPPRVFVPRGYFCDRSSGMTVGGYKGRKRKNRVVFRNSFDYLVAKFLSKANGESTSKPIVWVYLTKNDAPDNAESLFHLCYIEKVSFFLIVPLLQWKTTVSINNLTVTIAIWKFNFTFHYGKRCFGSK